MGTTYWSNSIPFVQRRFLDLFFRLAVRSSWSFNCSDCSLFPEGIMGWLREKYPEKFGEVIDEADRKAQVELN